MNTDEEQPEQQRPKPDKPNQDSSGFFEHTIWSTIIKAQMGSDDTRLAALGRLLARYLKPILRHIQASQHCTLEQAKDLTQDFIHQCIRLDFLKQVSPEHGRFRTFVKTCVSNFLRDQHAKEAAAKRGGGKAPVSLDETDGEGNRLLDPAATTSPPETVLDREWALSVLDGALELLKRECEAARRGDLFEALKGHLDRAPKAGTAAQIAARLGMKKGTVHTAMSRMRKRLGELIWEEVRPTVGTDEECQQELRYLVELLGH